VGNSAQAENITQHKEVRYMKMNTIVDPLTGIACVARNGVITYAHPTAADAAEVKAKKASKAWGRRDRTALCGGVFVNLSLRRKDLDNPDVLAARQACRCAACMARGPRHRVTPPGGTRRRI
jgi:hypothetical protein